jgi:putative spermidine/putrescine transport system substrate-binding protein
MAVLADGVPADKVYPLDIERGFKKLDELRPSIRAFWTSADQPVQGAANGEFAAGTTWSGRVATAMRQGKPVAASWNGALLHEAWNFILKGAAHPRAAEALLYFMQRADRQAELGKLTGYTGGNKNAAALLDPSVAAMLPASPEHVAVAAPVDGAWWAENISQVQARWDAWIAKR